MEAATGVVAVEKVNGKSTATRSFSTYPLKLIIPNKVGPASSDAVWVYALSYGGGIVSVASPDPGDRISCKVDVGEGCTVAMTTQASTKVYKSVGSKCSEQVLEARVGRNALLAVIPDPVTCFSSARYSQKQVFRVSSDSGLVIVDWITSGRHESGEKWDFQLYRSTNHIFTEGDQPLFLDSVLLDQGSNITIAERMQGYHVVAMVIILGPQLKHVQNQVTDEVKKMMSGCFRIPNPATRSSTKVESKNAPARPALIASCSTFGPKAVGVVVRIAATTTDSVYTFLRHLLASLEPLIGALPYR